MVRPDQLVADAELDEEGATNQKGAENEIAEGRVLCEQLAQALRRDGQHLSRLAHDGREERPAAREDVQVAEKAVTPVGGDRPLLARDHLQRLDEPFEDDDEVIARVALAEEQVTRRGAESSSVPLELFDLLVAQARKRAGAVGRLYAHNTGVAGGATAKPRGGREASERGPGSRAAGLAVHRETRARCARTRARSPHCGVHQRCVRLRVASR